MPTSSKEYASSSLLFMCILCDVFIRPFYSSVRYNARVSIISMCISLIITLLVFFIVTQLINDGAKLIGVLRVICGIFFLFSAASVFIKSEQFYRYISTETLPIIVFIAIFISIALYAAHMPQVALLRVSVAALSLCLLSIVLIIVSNVASFHIENLSLDGTGNILQAVLNSISFPPEILLFFLISTQKSTVKVKQFTAVMGCVAIVFAILTISSELVMGNASSWQSQSVHTMARVGAISVFKRLDAIFASIWVFSTAIKFSAFFCFAVNQLLSCKKTIVYYIGACVTQITLIGILYIIPNHLIKSILSVGTIGVFLAIGLSSSIKLKKERSNETMV